MTKVKAAIRMYENQDPAMKMVREFDERAESFGHKSIVKDAAENMEIMSHVYYCRCV